MAEDNWFQRQFDIAAADIAARPNWLKPDWIRVPAGLPDLEPGKRYMIRYTNYTDRTCSVIGETADRLIEPVQHRYWGQTEYHPEYQWLIKAKDVQRGVERDFALKDMVLLPIQPSIRELTEQERQWAMEIDLTEAEALLNE